MTIFLQALTRPDLQALARSEVPPALVGRFAEGALPPDFVAARALEHIRAGKPPQWCSTYYIVRQSDQVVVGGCGFKDAPAGGSVEIGYAVSPQCRKQGIATAAVRALLQKAFASAEVQEVRAEIDLSNIASTRVVQKLDFEHCGTVVAGEDEPFGQWSRRR